jgi:hypothetical protein
LKTPIKKFEVIEMNKNMQLVGLGITFGGWISCFIATMTDSQSVWIGGVTGLIGLLIYIIGYYYKK